MTFDDEFRKAVENALDSGAEAEKRTKEIHDILSEFADFMSNILTERFDLPIKVYSHPVVIREQPSIFSFFSENSSLPVEERPVIAEFNELVISDPEIKPPYEKRICKFTIDSKFGYPCNLNYGSRTVYCNSADELKNALLQMVEALGLFFNEVASEIKAKSLNRVAD